MTIDPTDIAGVLTVPGPTPEEIADMEAWLHSLPDDFPASTLVCLPNGYEVQYIPPAAARPGWHPADVYGLYEGA